MGTDRKAAAFLLPPNAATLSPRAARLSTHRTAPRRTAPPPHGPPQMATRPPAKRVSWLRVALLAAGTAAGSGLGLRGAGRAPDGEIAASLLGARATHAAPAPAGVQEAGSVDSTNVISLKRLGIKRDDFLSDRELRRRKTTQFSEAEEEIMELEEWEVSTQWFRDLQLMWAGVASVAGMFVLYKGGVLWENWIKEQEQKDMEEEIELTGTFIDPRAVRKDEDEDDGAAPKKPKAPESGDGPKPGDEQGGGDNPSGGIESLERIFGKS